MFYRMTRPGLIFADTLAGAAIVGSLVQWLPAFAAVVGAIWYGVQIYESKTCQQIIVRISTWLSKSTPPGSP